MVVVIDDLVLLGALLFSFGAGGLTGYVIGKTSPPPPTIIKYYPYYPSYVYYYPYWYLR
ncbi:MAG: hypothetical protein QW589_05890 [Candidatus Bathyarchaeia archaeon]